ncbi:adenine deaminase [Lacihabitans lacunae]|uniref:Adenine deaminase n=1 Tax=Lacihabitans lacunae TaxID=1028214 RepID=A0ABV7YTP3_9BACT
MQIIEANIVNIFDNTVFHGEISIHEGRIYQIKKLGDTKEHLQYAMPGFIDAHVHVESSMLTPSQFGKLAVVHGTVGTVSDPHEIANVLGKEGVKFMIENGKTIPFKFCFGAPSCVPATSFETAGAQITSEDIADLLASEDIGYLAEMMNYPGAIHEDPEVMSKIAIAKKYFKPIDGHAPGLRGEDAVKYFSHGISTDHECFTFEEAEEKLNLGVKILIREGSAAKNFDALIGLAENKSSEMMFCSDDKHPDDLVEGHINLLVKRAVAKGLNLFKALRMASLNPVRHYNLKIGLLREGEAADFIMVDNLEDLNVTQTYIDGKLVAQDGVSMIENITSKTPNQFNAKKIEIGQLAMKFEENTRSIRVIQVNEGQLVTDEFLFEINPNAIGFREDLRKADILKIVVYNRYTNAEPAIGYIKGFGLRTGAIASSVAHDSHNIIAVGVDDKAIMDAINLVVREKGGISAVGIDTMGVLPLPVAGIMSNKDGYEVAKDYTQIDQFAKDEIGCVLKSPFMSLSFMALLVIPSLKLSDKGLFDGNKFEFVSLAQ